MNKLSRVVLSFTMLSCLFMAGCGNLLDPIQDDPRFEPIKKQFTEDAKVFGINPDMSNLKIAFGDTNKDMKYAGFITISKGDGSSPDGYCQILKTDNSTLSPIQKIAFGKKYKMRVIVISNKYKKASLEFLETLVYHELGHCVLGRSHSHDSIMGYDINYMGVSRYFWLREFFKREPMDYSLVVKKIDFVSDDMEPIYEMNYSGFNENIFQRLYYDKSLNQYYSVDNFESNPTR